MHILISVQDVGDEELGDTADMMKRWAGAGVVHLGWSAVSGSERLKSFR